MNQIVENLFEELKTKYGLCNTNNKSVYYNQVAFVYYLWNVKLVTNAAAPSGCEK